MNSLHFPLALWVSFFVNQDKPISPPAEWHGVWRGKLVITDAEGKTSETKILLKIEPIADTRDLRWVVTTGEGEISSTKNCILAPAGEKAGFFHLKEGAARVDARFVNGVIYSQGEVGGRLQNVRYELRGDVLRYEVMWSKKSGSGVEVVQVAELKKK